VLYLYIEYDSFSARGTSKSDLAFNWTCSSFSAFEANIQLVFANPRVISKNVRESC